MIPGPSWLLDVKMDRAEVFAPLFGGFWTVGLIAALLLLTVTLGVALWRQQQQLQSTRQELAKGAGAGVTQQASEKPHRNLLRHLYAGVVVYAPDTSIMLANEAASTLLGLSLEQLQGKVATDPDWCFYREDETRMPVAEYPVVRAIRSGRLVESMVVGISRPTTQDRIWVLATAFPEFDASEQLSQVVVTFVDITERKRAETQASEAQAEAARLLAADDLSRRALLSLVEDLRTTAEALLKQKQFAETILEHSPSGFAVYEIATERTRYVSTRFEDICGVPSGSLQDAKDYYELMFADPMFREQMRIRIKADSDAGDPALMHWDDIPLTTPTGKQKLVSIRNIPLSDQGLMVSSVMDVTERGRAEADLRASLQEKVALLKEVHHRVKNTLQVIISLLRLESSRHSEPGTKLVLREMQSRIHSMALLHETLYRAGVFAQTELGSYLKQIATQLFRTHRVGVGQVTMQLELAEVLVELDQALPCGLIVNELVTNCLKHAFPDQRSGEVRIALRLVPGGWVRLQVSDTGVGMPDAFDSTRATSLGLQLVSDLAGQLGGTLTTGPGAEFSVDFPHLSTEPP